MEPDVARAVKFLEKYCEFAELYKSLNVIHVTSGILADKIAEQGLIVSPQVIPDEAASFLSEMFAKYGTGYPSDRQFMHTHIFGTNLDHSTYEKRGIFLTVIDIPEDFLDFPAYGVYEIPERIRFMCREFHTLSNLDRVDENDKAQALAWFESLSAPYLQEGSTAIAVQLDPMHPDIIRILLNPHNVARFEANLESANPIRLDDSLSDQANLFRIFKRSNEAISDRNISPDAIISITHRACDVDKLLQTLNREGSLFPSRPFGESNPFIGR